MEIVLKNDFAEIPPVADAVDGFLGTNGAPDDVRYVAHLVIEELVTNTIKYGYDDEGSHEIHIQADIENNALVMRVSDDGHPFNPLDAPDPDTSLPAAERPIGGLGLYLVRSMTDSLVYERRDGWNFVTISKSFSSGPQELSP